VGAKPREWPAETDIWLPAEVVDSLVDYLTKEESISSKKASAMVFRLAYLREIFCPQVNKLKPGQVTWIGISATRQAQVGLKNGLPQPGAAGTHAAHQRRAQAAGQSQKH